MSTTLTLELPPATMETITAMPPSVRVELDSALRAVANAFATAYNIPDELEDEQEPELSEEDFAAIGRGLADLDAGRTTSGEIVFARLREKYGFPKGDNPL